MRNGIPPEPDAGLGTAKRARGGSPRWERAGLPAAGLRLPILSVPAMLALAFALWLPLFPPSLAVAGGETKTSEGTGEGRSPTAKASKSGGASTPAPAARTADRVALSAFPEESTKPTPSPLPVPPSGTRPSAAQVQTMIAQVAKQYGVEQALVKAVVGAESNYNAHAVSPVGAVGLMQVMPATAGDYGVSSTRALFDPMTNLRTGTRHLKRLLNKYNNDYGRVIMAYNAGEGVVDRTGSNVTFQETLDYTEAVIRNYNRHGGTQPTAAALTKVRALRGMRNGGKARRLLKKYLDPSLLSLRVKPTLTLRSLNPALHEAGPESRPMFELDTEALR